MRRLFEARRLLDEIRYGEFITNYTHKYCKVYGDDIEFKPLNKQKIQRKYKHDKLLFQKNRKKMQTYIIKYRANL